MNDDFKILSKIKYLIEYSNEYIFSSFPKDELALKINFEKCLYNILEECIRANYNKGNIRNKHITEIMINSSLCDYYIGLIKNKKIIKTNRYTAVINALEELIKMSNGWLKYEENK